MRMKMNNQTHFVDKNQGFTLIELLFVVAIIGVLGAIIYPSYSDSAKKSKRADARIALVEAAARQERAYTQSGAYLADADIAKLVTNSDGVSSPDGHYKMSVDTSACSSDGTCFTMVATAQDAQASDTDCATLSLSYLGQKTSTGGGECW